MDSIEFDAEGSEGSVSYDTQTVEGFAERLVASGEWCKSDALDLRDGLRWRPNLISADGTKIAHLHFADELRSYVVERIRATHAAGLIVHIVLPLAALYDADVLEVLAESDAMVHIVDVDLERAEHHLDAISKARVPLGPESRKSVALTTWRRMREGSSSVKGKRFERFLAFLLDQTLGLEVVERNYRGDTDEIDLVVQVVRYTGSCWFQEGVPFILVEAKNRAEATAQHMVSNLIRRLQTKHGTSRIGILFTTSKFTQDAVMEVVKIAEGTLTVVLVTPDEIGRWIEAADPSAYLEGLVRHAMLR
jgi:hypothetical protein